MIMNEDMVLVKKGLFEMGSNDIDADSIEKPRHKVFVNDFYIDKYMVTNKKFAEFCADTNFVTTAEIDRKGDTIVHGKFQWVKGADWKHPYGPDSSIDLMDMAGNAWDWCVDAMDQNYYEKELTITEQFVARGREKPRPASNTF
jgi:formylglycine-generating enzyme required for sulfatase activity